MTALPVSSDLTAEADGDLGAVIASLPISLTSAAPGRHPGDLVAIHGGPGWPKRVAETLVDSTQGLMLVGPTPVHPGEVPDASFVPVVIDYPYANNPALTAAGTAFSHWPADALVEVAAVHATADNLDRLLLDQLATLRRLGLAPAWLRRLRWDTSGYYLAGMAVSGSPVLLSAHVTTGATASLWVRGLSADSVVEVTLPDPSTARPGSVTRTTASGAMTSPTIWESAHRASWRRLSAAVRDLRLTNDLVELRDDLSVAEQVLPTADRQLNHRPTPKGSTQ